MRPIFRHYWWIAVAGAIVGAGAIFRFANVQERGTLAASLIAGLVTFCFLVHQQKLAETRLFKDLFTEFNERYDKINNDLLDIKNDANPCSPAAVKKLIDYFNLCSEEFLFYEEGYIHPTVWRSWSRGVLDYLDAPHIRVIWETEVERTKNNYYGLTFQKLLEGAAL